MSEEPYFTPNQLSKRWKISKMTLKWWRWSGDGPAYTKFGKSVRYNVDAVERYEQQNLKAHTSSP